MDSVLSFDKEVNKAMQALAADPRTLFVGQSVAYDGAKMYNSLEGIPQAKRLEMPVIEDFQLGFCIGLSLKGRVPICMYPRLDFVMLAMNQLVNHLDRIEEMSDFTPKVIVRTAVGSTKPLNAGPQHTGNYCEALSTMLRHVQVIELNHADDVVECYRDTMYGDKSFLIVENPKL